MASTGGRVMEKPIPQDQRAAVLRCPRCDSSNTKFCYYNNYSLSQPRHFCKACKRYWTRGGTLRNVPVGGGYRKNKRIKKPTTSSSANPAPASHNHHHHQIEVSKAANSQVNSLFYSLPNQLSHDINLTTIPRFHPRESITTTTTTTTTLPLNSSTASFHDHLQPQFNTLGKFDFSSTTDLTTGLTDHGVCRNGFNPITSNFSLFGNSSSLSTTPPMTTSLLASSLQHQKLNWGGLKESNSVLPTNYFQDLSTPFEGLQMVGNINDPRMVVKGIQIEEENKKKVDWSSAPFENSSLELNGSSDSSLYWNSTTGANWTDLSNYGSSATPLI